MRNIAAAALAALVILGGCAKVDTGAKSTGGRQPWTRPGRLVIGSAGEEPDSLNKLFANTDAADQIANLIYEPLLRYDQTGEYVPAAAREVPTTRNGGISADGKTVTLRLRPGMQWSDGAPYDGRDLVFTWKAVMNDRNNTRVRVGWDDITAMDLRDPTTVVVHLKRPYGAVLGIFAIGGAGYPPLPAHLLEKLPDINHAAFNTQPISTGPFVLSKWNHGSSLEFAANPKYWRGKPGLDAITYRVIPNADTLFNALQTHEVDVYDSVTENQIDRLATLSGYAVSKTLIANLRRLQFNMSRPIVREYAVREAVAEGVDWDRINATIYHGYNERAAAELFPKNWAAPSGIPVVRFNPGHAKTLLENAGWKAGRGGIRTRNGEPLTFSVSTTVSKPANIQAELQMQQQLLAAGIKLEIKNYPTSLLFAQTGPIYTGKYDSEFTIETQGPDPDNEGLWSGSAIPPHGANTSWVNDPVITRAATEANQTFDRARRKALYQREQQRLADLRVIVPLYWQNSFSAVNRDLKNWKPAAYISDFWNCWEWSI